MPDSYTPTAEVDYDDIENAFMFVSGGMEGDNTAWLDRKTGQIYYKSRSAGLDERLPDDDDDGIFSESDYTAIPHQYDLDLGQNLVFRFIEAERPDAFEEVRGLFRRRGAYARYKQWLEHEDLLQAWYDFEARETETALRAWCAEKTITLRPSWRKRK